MFLPVAGLLLIALPVVFLVDLVPELCHLARLPLKEPCPEEICLNRLHLRLQLKHLGKIWVDGVVDKYLYPDSLRFVRKARAAARLLLPVLRSALPLECLHLLEYPNPVKVTLLVDDLLVAVDGVAPPEEHSNGCSYRTSSYTKWIYSTS